MIISEIIYRLLPESLFAGLQQQYHELKKAIYKPMSLDDFEDVLNKLNIRKGDVVFIHSSYDKLHLSFSVLQMLKTLQERVGPEGTLLFPSWSYAGRTEDYLKSNKPFDVRKSFTRMGLLPEVARRKKTAIRSFHPTAAIAAIGKHAEELTNTHHLSSYACDENSPYFKMMKYNAKIIGLGEKTTSLSFVHCVEDVMKTDFPRQIYYPEPFNAVYQEADGSVKPMKVFVHRAGNHSNIPKFIRKKSSPEACKQFSVKGRNYFVADAELLFDEMIRLAKQKITIYDF
jgi:aminoglycoside 3-N-acetyltransferase